MRRRTPGGRYASDLPLLPPPAPIAYEDARRLVGMRSVWKRLSEAGDAVHLSTVGEGAEYVPPETRLRLVAALGELEDTRAEINALAPSEDALRAYVSVGYWNASPAVRAELDKLRNRGRLRRGRGGKATKSARKKKPND